MPWTPRPLAERTSADRPSICWPRRRSQRAFVTVATAKRPPPRRECARRGPSSHPPAKPRGRDHARHRRPGTQCSATLADIIARMHAGPCGHAWAGQPGMDVLVSSTGPDGLHRANASVTSRRRELALRLVRGGDARHTPAREFNVVDLRRVVHWRHRSFASGAPLAHRLSRARRVLSRLRRAAAWSCSSPGLRAVSASRCLDAAEEGVEAGGEPLVAVAGPDVLAEGSQEGEAAGWQ